MTAAAAIILAAGQQRQATDTTMASGECVETSARLRTVPETKCHIRFVFASDWRERICSSCFVTHPVPRQWLHSGDDDSGLLVNGISSFVLHVSRPGSVI